MAPTGGHLHFASAHKSGGYFTASLTHLLTAVGRTSR
jgi:hypothetical protein